MGSEAYSYRFLRILIKLFSVIFWKAVIVKTSSMKKRLRLKNALILPNGVDIDKFKVIEKKVARTNIGFDQSKKYILFMSNPARSEKNFSLAQSATNELSIENLSLVPIYNIKPAHIPVFYSSADVLILTSIWEGSPNVIKEAMACNCPIVSTDVGDVNWVIGETAGCFLTSFKIKSISQKIKEALEFAESKGRTKGRERIIELGLDSESVSRKIIGIYRSVLNA